MCGARSFDAGEGGPRQTLGGIRRWEAPSKFDHLGSLTGSHPLDTPEEATARFEKADKQYEAVRAVVNTLDFGDVGR